MRPRRLDPWLMAAVAALASIAALSWTAAEGGRGLDGTDFRSVVIVTVAVGVAAFVSGRRRGDVTSERPVANDEQRQEGAKQQRRGDEQRRS